MIAVLVGGPCDGRRMAVEDLRPVLTLAVVPPIRLMMQGEDTSAAVPGSFPHVYYHATSLTAGHAALVVYRAEALTLEEVLARLVAGSTPPQGEEVAI